MECRAKYGPLHHRGNYRRFLRDWLRSRQFARSRLDAEEFVLQAAAHRTTYTEFLRFFMERMADDQAVSRWAEKTPQHTFFMRELAAAFPEARFINVIRDGRDVALSMRRLGWSGTRSRSPLEQLLYSAAIWQWYAHAARRAGLELGRRYLEIRYEDVVTEPDAAILTVNGFCHTQVTAQVVAASSVGALGAGHSAFATGMSGIASDGLYRWQRTMTARESRVVDAAVANSLRAFGYPVADAAPGWPSFINPHTRRRLALAIKDRLKRKTPLGRILPSPLEFD
jgi:hypothetical protein